MLVDIEQNSNLSSLGYDFVYKSRIFLSQGMRGREGAEEGPLRHSHELPRTVEGAEISKPGEKNST